MVKPCPRVAISVKMNTTTATSMKPIHAPRARCSQNPSRWNSVLASLLVFAEKPLCRSCVTPLLSFIGLLLPTAAFSVLLGFAQPQRDRRRLHRLLHHGQ